MTNETTFKTISALDKVGSYELAANFTEIYSVIGGENTNIVTTNWEINKLVDIRQKGLRMSTTIEQEGINISSFEVYVIDELIYIHSTLPSANDAGGIPDNHWIKVPLFDETWMPASQLNPQIELLKTATQTSLTESEYVNNIDCYVLNITPTGTGMAEWIISQQQPGGPSLRWWHTTSERSKEIYTKAFNNSIIKLWIAKNNYLIMKAEISANFEVTPLILEPSDVPLSNAEAIDYGFDKIIADFHWQMNYSSYNQPVIIKLPQEALDNQ